MTRLKKFTAILASTTMLLSSTMTFNPFTAVAEGDFASYDLEDEGSAIGEYVGDPDLEAYVEEKERIAELLYNATISGNNELATQLRVDLNELETDKLNQFCNNVQVYSNENAVFSYTPPPASYTISNFYQYPQIKSYYCGPATAHMILKAMGITKTQTVLAGSNYLDTETYGETPWYITDGSSPSQFVMATTLNAIQSYKYYTPSPLGQAGSNPLTVTQCKSYVMSATSNGYGIALCGQSKANINDPSHLPGYPTNRNIGHWLACRGYYGSGNYIWLVDPAYGAESVSFSDDITGTYAITAEKYQAFIATRGMIW